MKKVILSVFVAVLFVTSVSTFTSCQSCTRKTGGTTYIELKENQKFENITWKNDNIWVLVENTENPKEHRFIEYSNFGVFEGEVVITEK